MLLVHPGLVAMLVAIDARKGLVVRGNGMAIRAHGPPPRRVLAPCRDREPRSVVERRRSPGGGGVARLAIRPEPCSGVPGVRCGIVPRQVAVGAATGRRGPGIDSADVARCARRGQMRSGEPEGRQVVIEGSRPPCGGGMTRRAIRRKPRMFWVRGRGECLLVTRVAHGRRTRIHAVEMALGARNRTMRPGELEGRQVMIEGRRSPRGRGVARKARCGETGVFRTRRAGEDLSVTAIAVGLGGVEIASDMAPRARKCAVGTCERELRGRVIEVASPAQRVDGMALRAVGP